MIGKLKRRIEEGRRERAIKKTAYEQEYKQYSAKRAIDRGKAKARRRVDRPERIVRGIRTVEKKISQAQRRTAPRPQRARRRRATPRTRTVYVDRQPARRTAPASRDNGFGKGRAGKGYLW